MSDYGRKDFSDRVEDKFTPDTSKSTLDKSKEHATGTYDKAARDLVSDEHKSTSQEISDKASRTKDAHTSGHESTLDKIKDKIPGMGKHHD